MVMQQQHDTIEKKACITRGLLGRVSTRTNSHNKVFYLYCLYGGGYMDTQLLKVVPAGIFFEAPVFSDFYLVVGQNL